jgi:hypothetical protein
MNGSPGLHIRHDEYVTQHAGVQCWCAKGNGASIDTHATYLHTVYSPNIDHNVAPSHPPLSHEMCPPDT